MRRLFYPLTKALLLLTIMMIAVQANAQISNFNLTLANDVQVSDRILEFDVIMLDTDPVQPFELGGDQEGILVNPAIYNGGTISVSIVAGSSQLVPSQQHTSIIWSQAQNTIKLTPVIPPPAGSGTILSTTAPGTKICRLRITNTVAFTANSQANLAFNFTTSPYPTKVSQYIGTTNTQLVCDATNCFSNAANIILNPPISVPTAFSVTGTGSYCQGGIGSPVGLANSESGVTYTLFKNNVAQVPTVAGTGSAITFGNQLFGTYTISGTNTSGTTSMTGNAVITENPSLPASVSIAASPAGAICAGTSVTFTATPVNGGTPTYQWMKGATPIAGQTGATYTSTTLAGGDVISVVMTSSLGCSSGSPATSNAVTMTVNPVLPASVSITASPSGAVCSGTSVTFTATPVNGGTPTYQWMKGATPIAGQTGATYTSAALANGDVITVEMTSSLSCTTGSPATSNAVTMTVNANLPASVNIAASPAGAICTGTSVTFTATPVNGGTPTYQWMKGATPIAGQTGATYTSTSLTNGDIITVVMTSSLTCSTGSPATSNAVTMTVNPALPASVSIAASPTGAICAGTSVTFTATPVNGGTPTYQWMKGATPIAGQTGATYTSTTLANSDAISVVMTSSLTCSTGSPATSNAVTMTVNPVLPASVSIAASPAGAICAGTSVTFTATPVNGGTPTYQWLKGGVAIAGQTGATYTSTTLANGDAISVVMTSTLSCSTGSPATSNAVTMIVNANLPASVSIAASPSDAICAGTSVTFTATPVNGGTPTYQWMKGATPIAGQTGATYTSTSLANADVISVVMTSSLGCSTGSPATSNAVRMTVNPVLPASVSIAASPAGAICAGTSVTFTATPVNGGTPTYQWMKGGVAIAGQTGATYTSTTLANGDAISVVMTSTLGCSTGSPATSNAVTMTVNANLPASVSISASPAGAICAGTSVTFTATPVNGGTPTYQWMKGGVAIAGQTGATYTSTTLANGDAISVVMTSSLSCSTGSPATSNAVTMTVNANLPASVSITASPSGTICAGTSVTFTATPVNGGTPTYQWMKGGVAIAGQTGATYTSTTFANGDAISVVMTSSLSCSTGSPATSNAVTMTVNANLPASVSIAASPAGAICAGTSVTFTATPVNGGTPTYQWMKGGVAIAGQTGATYTSTSLANGDAISVVMTSSLGCTTGSPATSNAVTMTVNPVLPVSVSIAASPAGAICAGTSVTFTATPVNGGTPTYQWMKGGVAIAGQTGATYTSTTLANGDAISVVMTSTLGCATGSPATSNAVTMTVNANLPASVSIAASPAGAICAGTSVTFTATPVNGGTPTYQWMNGGVAIAGQTGATYTSTSLANADVISVVMTSTLGCATGSPATSNAVTMTVNANLPASVSITASPAGAICAGTSVTFTATPVNGGTPTYQWMKGVTPIAGQTGATYTSTTLANGDAISVVMTSSLGCSTGSPATSNAVTMTVNPVLPASVSIAASPAGAICAGTSVTFTATPVNGGTPTYRWMKGGVAIAGQTGATYTSAALANGDIITVEMTSSLSCPTGSPSTSNAVTMTVNPVLPASVSIAALPAGTICAGTSVTFTATLVNGGTPTYQWMKGGVAIAGQTGATYTSAALANGDVISVVMTSSLSCSTGSPATSNAVTMTVNANLPASISIAASPAGAICAGTSVTFTATPVNGGTPTYQWMKGGVAIAGQTGATYTSTTLANSDAISVVMTSSLGCSAGSPATSNAVTMTVNANLPASVSIAASPSGSICAGTAVTFTATPVNGGTPTYQWMKGGVAIAGQTGATYTSATLANSDVISVVMTSTLGCSTGSPATSNAVTMTVNANLPASVSIAASPAGAICAGTSVTFTATPVNGGTPTYQWMKGATPIAGQTGATYTSTTLANGDVISVVMTSSLSCSTGSPATSNAVTMTVNPVLPASVSIAASPAGAICAGTSVTFTATPVNGGTPIYQWMKGGVAISGQTGATYTSAALANGDIITAEMTSSLGCSSGSPATSNAVTMTVNANLPASVSIVASPAGAICAGTSVTFTATPVNGGTPTYQWMNGGVAIAGQTGSTYTSSALANGDIITVEMTSSLGCSSGSPATSNAVTMTVNANLPASISIAASPAGVICAGTSVTFTATPVNGGTPTYQWMKGGVAIADQTGATYTSTTLANSDVISVVMTSSLSCSTGSPATSNAVTMTVNPVLPASVSIAASPAGAICAGTSVTFTATPVNGGTPTYQWMKGGVAISGQTGATYTSITLANSDVISVVMTSSLGCSSGSPAKSNAVTMTVNPVLPASVSIAASPAGAICAGTSVTFTATPVNGGTPTYQWMKGGVAIAGQTGATYTSTILANGDVISVVMTSSLSCSSGSPATSNAVTMTVNPVLPVSVSIAASPGGAICAGTSVTFTAIPVNGGTPTYQWMKGGVAIAGQTGATYTSTTLANSDVISVVMTSSLSCSTGSPATSNAVTMTVNPVLPASVSIAASPAGAICAGTSVTFTATPVNGGTPTYQWMKGGVAIAGQTGATYTSTTLANGDAISVVMTSSLGCTTGSPATSNAMTMTVNPVLPSSVTIAASPAGAICSGTSVTFTATPVNGGTPSYQWMKGGVAIAGQTGGTYTSTTLANSDVISVVMTSSLGCSTGSPATSNAVSMTINPVIGTAGTIMGNASVSTGTQSVVYSVPAILNASTYVWSLPNGATIASGDGTQSITINFSNSATSGNVSVFGSNSCGNSNTSSIAVDVILQPGAGTLPGAAGIITGQSTFGRGATGVIYSVDPIANATSYTWTLPQGATIVSGAGTNSITVDFGINAVSGNITVYGSNTLGNGAVSPVFAVNIQEAKLLVYPVPNDGLFTALYTSPVETTLNIAIYSNTGSKILEIKDAPTVNGSYEKVFDLRPIQSGIYYIEFINGKVKDVRKVIINRR